MSCVNLLLWLVFLFQIYMLLKLEGTCLSCREACLRLPSLRAAACLDIEFKKKFCGNTNKPTKYCTLCPCVRG